MSSTRASGANAVARSTTSTVVSADGTSLATEAVGAGPVLVLVDPAMATRRDSAKLTTALAPHFTVVGYDRRGRGDSGDADPTVFQRLMLPGRMGRPGIEQYSTVSAEPLDKWRETMGSWYRKRWCRHYLERLGMHRLALMGYDYDRLMREVGELDDSPRRIASDIARSAYGLGHQAVTRSLMYPGRRERQIEAQEKQQALAAERT